MWIQRYDSVNDFSELLPYVMFSLDEILEWKDSSDASMLRNAIDTEFLISLSFIKVCALKGIKIYFIIFFIRILVNNAP